jgi:hypothetical protein
MSEIEANSQYFKFKVVNIVLYPEGQQLKKNYIDILEKIYKEKKTVHTHGERCTLIRTFYKSADSNIIHGDISNALFLNPQDMALDSKTNEIVQSNADPDKGFGLKIWNYFFFPEYHRLVIDSTASEKQLLKFLDETFNIYMRQDDYEINMEKDRQTIERIINAPALSKLLVRVSYSNNDNEEGWEGIIDRQLKDSCSKNAKLELKANKKAPIQISKSEMVKGFIKLSASNGYAEASEIEEDGTITHITTQDHPLINTVSYIDDGLGVKLKDFVKRIAHKEI